MELVLPDLRAGYATLVQTVHHRGAPVTVRGLPTRELTGVTLVFEHPVQPLLPVGVGRGVNLQLAAVEALSLVAGVVNPTLLERASPRYGDVLVDPTDLGYGAYGPRACDQLATVVRDLHDNPTTRQAVLSIWRPDDLVHRGDRPCTVALQFLRRDEALQLHVTMRSQDVWLGSAYDHFMFSQLQLTVARLLGVGVGRYVHHVGSLHLYDHHLAATHRLLGNDLRPGGWSLPLGVSAQVEGRDPAYRLRYLRQAARALLEGPPSRVPEAFVRRNGWYVQQLTRLHRPRKVPA